MNGPNLLYGLLVIALTIASGFGDSRGFLHASLIWQNGHFVPLELLKSAVGFACGISIYWITLRFAQDFGIVSAEIQTLAWFTVTIIGVALANGEFFAWQSIDKVVAVVVFSGIAWLLFRTG